MPKSDLLANLKLPQHSCPPPCACEATCGYVRVSAVMGREHLLSPQIQVDSIAAEAARKGRRVVRWMFDIDKDGRTFTKRKVAKVIEEMHAGQYRHVTLWKWSRWGRNLEESLVQLEKVRQAGGRVDSATEDYDQDKASGRLGRDIMLRFEQYQDEVIGENWKNAHNQRREIGKPHSGRARFGYKYEARSYTIDNDQGALVRDAYERLSVGSSLRSLTQEWNARGVTTTMGGRWTPQALGKMLDTGFAAGYIRERSKPSQSPVNRMRDYDIWRKGEHEPIISEDLWQAYRARREHTASIPPRARRAVHALSALMFCGDCGRRLSTKYAGTNRTHQWVCNHRAAYHPDVSVGISNAIAMADVREWLRRMAQPGNTMGPADVEREAERIAAQQDQVRSEVDACLARIMAVRDRVSRLREMRLDDAISREEFNKRKAGLDAEEQAVRVELARARVATTHHQGIGPEARAAFAGLDAEWDVYTPEEHREALATVVGMVVIGPRASEGPRFTVVPAWEMSSWAPWLAERRRWES